MSDTAPRPTAALEPQPSLLARIRNRDHTQGSLLASVAALSLPAILMSALGFGVFQLVDLRFLAMLGDAEVAAAGAANQTLRQVFMLLIMGLTVSSQMMVARFVGEGDVDSGEHVAGQSFLLGAAIAVLAACTVGMFPRWFMSLIARDPEVIALGATYARIAFLSLGVMISAQVFTAVLSGAGDSTTPMIVSLVVAPISIFLEWTLAFGHFGTPALGIVGIALGAALGGSVGLLVAIFAITGGRARVHLRARHLVPDWVLLRRLLGIAWQPAVHLLARTMIIVFFMALAGRLGGKVQAAYTIGLRVEMLAIMVAFPISNACATLVGQNLASRNVARAWRAVWVCLGVDVLLLLPIAATLFLFRASIVAVFTDDLEVAAMAAEYLGYSSVLLLYYGFYFVAFRTLQAAGDMRTPMRVSVSSAVFIGVPLAYVLAVRADLGASGMWMANLVYGTVNVALMVGWLLRGHWARPPTAP